MRRALLVRVTGLALLLGTVTIACTPDGGRGHVAGLSDRAAPGAEAARAALARHQGARAVALAERAVAETPQDAALRRLLGQAYLADGRARAAATAFDEALRLAPDQASATLGLALAEIGLGDAARARTRLAALAGRAPVADLGLALALAGDRAAGIAMLTQLIRDGQSDARARQNLAFALALDGRWAEARGMAMQDTPPDRIEAQIAGWAALTGPDAAARQIAHLFDTTPRSDDMGEPSALALALPASAPVALAAAEPAPVPATVPAPHAAPAIAAAPPPSTESAPAPVPAQVAEQMERPAALPMPAIAPDPDFGADLAARAARSALLLRTAQAMIPPLVRAPAAPSRLWPMGQGAAGFVVQLGAYARPAAADAAWREASRLSPRVARLTPVRGGVGQGGAALVRLSVGGFASRDAAAALCTAIRARGGACFVRAAAGDAPLRFVSRAAVPPRLALR
ncbi:tetratricopeptide repeat protein [Sphingomonas morindae]|uniref:SPOR domain-containing protein n=1 Tax=Sphingomonas morindae TaxID=1541170 RepID=A0ABY4X974_9SPHN|nr:SPOR domain-containing protein [Sphingomonas morindae]USI73220.1 SPOR domain-containing protein [Sphingomonas morindae]